MESEAARLECSIGIMAYNEATNIADAIASILQQRVPSCTVAEVIVVASGCTDATVPIVSAIAARDRRVRLVTQEHREGKASAINCFLAMARSPIAVLASADVRVKDGALDALLRNFCDPTVGMVGGRPVPVNNECSLLGHTVHLMWRMHDQVARGEPKLGEMVAFRTVIPQIPVDTPVDEISIQALIMQIGYRLVYEPAAIIHNRGPATVADFLRQRRRIYAGHLLVRRQQGYAAATMDTRRLVRTLVQLAPFSTPRTAAWTAGAVGLEALARGLGYYDYLRRRSHQIWQIAPTTKAPIASPSEAQSVMVFRAVDFHLQELELGKQAARALTQHVLHQVRRVVGPGATVTAREADLVIVLLAARRDVAEELAARCVRAVTDAPFFLPRRDDAILINLAYGIITFSSPVPEAQDPTGAVFDPASSALAVTQI